MTSQTKKFIGIDDIRGVRLSCTGCDAVLTLPIDKEIQVSRLLVCPHCQRPWLRLPEGVSAEVAVKQCIDALRTMGSILKGQQFNGFSLALEIPPDEKE